MKYRLPRQAIDIRSRSVEYDFELEPTKANSDARYHVHTVGPEGDYRNPLVRGIQHAALCSTQIQTTWSPQLFSAKRRNETGQIYRMRVDQPHFLVGSCPRLWCRSAGSLVISGGIGRLAQAVMADSLMTGSSLNGAMVSRVM
jgi:hypothetical protein